MIKNLALAAGTVAVSLLFATGVAFGQTTAPSPTPTVPTGGPSTGHGA